MPETDIRAMLQQRIREAESDLDRLRAALKAVDAPASPPARRKRPTSAKPKPAPEKRKPKVIPLGKLTDLLSSSNGLTTRELAKQTEGDSKQILELLKEAEAGDQVRREGSRASTKWFVVTDKDRVAARAAELAAQAR
jgi:hypothetical protein